MDYLPKDPAILVSSVNMLLRDEEFDTLESLCYNFGTEPKDIKNYLHGHGFVFSDKQKQFRPIGYDKKETNEQREPSSSLERPSRDDKQRRRNDRGMRKRLIIFDFDGTLGDTRRTIVTTMQMTIKELQLPGRSDDECAATIGLPLVGCFKAMFPDLQAEQIQLCADTYRRIFNENQRTIKPQAFPHVVETLTALKEQGFTLTIASSRSHASLSELTRDMGISESISYLIGADDVKKAKPDPEPVLKTLAAMHYDAGETLVVGDMAVDILMGANAGSKTCGVTWGNGTKKELQEAGADFIIDNMEELIGIADKI